MVKKLNKKDRQAWWRSLTLDEQADYVYEKVMERSGNANYQQIYSDLYNKGEFRVA